MEDGLTGRSDMHGPDTGPMLADLGDKVGTFYCRLSQSAVMEHPNRFISVWDEKGTLFTVKGMQNALRHTGDPANASRPSCTCPQGHEAVWCWHKRVAAAKLQEKNS